MYLKPSQALILALLMMAGTACAPADPPSLGVIQGQLQACPPSPNCVSSFAKDEEHRVAPLELKSDPKEALPRMSTLLKGMERVRIVEEKANYLRAEFTSRVFRFVDDVEFLLDAEAKVLHVRSASRTGYGDLGVNRERVETLRVRFKGVGSGQ